MKGFKIVVGLCLLLLLSTAIYFIVTDSGSTANFNTRGFDRRPRLDGFGVLFLFVCIAWMYIKAILQDRKIKKTKYRK